MASRSWNRVELIGNLTRDPELRFTPTGTAVASFGIATNRVYVSEGERKEDVDFHKLVAWGKLAELCNQLMKKGSRVFVSGRLQYREWETQDGQKRRDAEIVLEDLILLTPKSGFGGEEAEDKPVLSEEPKEPEEPKESKDESEEEEDKKPKAGAAPAPKADETIAADEDLPF